MQEVVRISTDWWRARYGQNFPDLLAEDKEAFLDSCIQDVYTMFKGVKDLWRHLDAPSYFGKTQLCYGLLVAWYIADLYPDYSVGVVSAGSGIPLKAKKIGNTTIQFADSSSTAGSSNNADLLQSLKSNAFGVKAYMMIKACGKLNLFIGV